MSRQQALMSRHLALFVPGTIIYTLCVSLAVGRKKNFEYMNIISEMQKKIFFTIHVHSTSEI